MLAKPVVWRLIPGVALVAAFWCGESFAQTPLSLNLAATVDGMKAKIAAGGQGNMLVLGDSLSFRPGSYLPYMRQTLQSAYGDAGIGTDCFSADTSFEFYSGVVAQGQVNGDSVPHHSLDGFWNTTWQGYQAVKFATTDATLEYEVQPGGGSLYMYRSDPTGDTPIATLNTASDVVGVRTFHYTAPADNLKLAIHPLGDGPVTLLGADYHNTTPGITVSRAANGGWWTQNFLQRDATFDGQLQLLHPDVTMITLGINDRVYITPSQFAANINAIIDRIQADVPGSKVLLVSPYANGDLQALADESDQEYAIAQARGVGFINLNVAGGNYNTYVSNGYLDDSVHFSPAGGQYVSNILSNAIITDGASLVPEPGAIGTIAGASTLALLLRRRVARTRGVA